MKSITEALFCTTIRGIDYCHRTNMLAVTSNISVLFLLSLSATPSDKIMPKHGYPAIIRFGHEFSHLLISDNEGPIDIFDIPSKLLTRSYLEHSDRVTGIDWARDGKSFMSSSKDGTVRLYELSLAHSHTTLDMLTGVCGIRCNPFNTSQIAFGTTKGKFFIYDTRKMAVPYLEVKGHSKTVSSVHFLSAFEILTTSVDSTAKLWDIHKTECKINYEGHNHRSYFVGVDSLESIFSLGGEDSYVRVYDKNYPNYVAIAKLSQQSYVSGCSWLSSKSADKEKFLCAVDNLGTIKYFSLQTPSSVD